MSIDYDHTLNGLAGFLKVEPDPSKPARPSDQQTLLRLLFWMTYEREGREFITLHREPDKDENAIRQAWLATLTSVKFNIQGDVLREAIIDGHLAASRYVAAFRINPTTAASEAEMALQQKIYQQNLSFVCWT